MNKTEIEEFLNSENLSVKLKEHFSKDDIGKLCYDVKGKLYPDHKFLIHSVIRFCIENQLMNESIEELKGQILLLLKHEVNEMITQRDILIKSIEKKYEKRISLLLEKLDEFDRILDGGKN